MQDKGCVVEHVIKNKRLFFCMNWTDWIEHKENVLTPGWTIFDKKGYLRKGV